MNIQNEDHIRLEKAYNTILDLEKKVETLQKVNSNEPIAVIGIGCKFPGNVNSPDEFYQMLIRGDNVIGDIPEKRWNFDKYDQKLKDKIYCRKGGFLSGIFDFDPLFFNISPLEAEYMDPQQRIFLETCWNAFEDAGYRTEKLNNVRCGVFAGVVSNDYFGYLDSITHTPEAYEVMGNYSSMLSGRISYFLNLRGPAITIDTACSSSAVAIHLACKSIQNGDSDIALAGGVTLYITPRPYLLMSESLMLSKNGQCFTFDDRADGFVPGEGCGVVLLKSLKKAVQDGDYIYGVIRGSGTNQDGKSNGITAPNALSQTELQLSVLKQCQTKAEDISYIEAHGTGTKLGDPIEIQALTEAFRKHTDKKQFCAIGSVKTNMGHLQGAAGVASLIKVLLSMRHGHLFPSINYQKANPHINLDKTPFYVNTSMHEWKVRDGIPKIAAINAFGFSGTNAHMIIEEYKPEKGISYNGPYLIPISANSKEALKKYAYKLKQYIISYQQDEKNSQEICNRIRSCVASILNVSEDEIDDNTDWDMIGLEPFILQQLADKLSCEMNILLSMSQLANKRNIGQLAHYLIGVGGFKNEDEFIANLAFTFQIGRNVMKIRELFIVHNTKELLDELDLFLKGKPFIDIVHLSNEAELCKQNWKQNGKADWEILYPNGTPNRISAPTYPFDKQEYILKPEIESNKELDLKMISTQSCYEYVVNIDSEGYSSHKVKDKEIMPAAFFIELMLETAVKELGNGVNCLQNIYFKNPLHLESGDIKVNLNSRMDKSNLMLECSVSKIYAQQECEYSVGKVEIRKNEEKKAPTLDLKGLTRAFDKTEWYNFVVQKSFKYGEKYQAVEQVRVYGEEVIATISVESFYSNDGDKYILNPYLLDSAIQPVVALIDATFPEHSLFLPYHIEKLYIYYPLTNKVTSYIKKSKVTKSEDSNTTCYYIDLYIIDENSRLLMELKNIGIKVIDGIESPVQATVVEKSEAAKQPPINITFPNTEVLHSEMLQEEVQIEVIQDYLKKTISELIKIPKDSIEHDKAFPSIGIDSFMSLKLIKVLETDIGRLPKTILFEYFNVEKLSEYIYSNFLEKFKRPTTVNVTKTTQPCRNTGTTVETSIQVVKLKAVIIPEAELDNFPEEKEQIEKIISRFTMEAMGYGRKEMAPEIFLGAKRESYFYIAQRNGIILAMFYNGQEEGLNELAEELTDYCLEQNVRVYFLLEHKLNKIKNRELGATTIGVLQRLEQLPSDLASKKYRHLRYAISHFEQSGKCHVEEYIINSDSEVNGKIVSLIDQWCESKETINHYIYKVREQILTKTFPQIHRFFLTYMNGILINVIIITPMPACNGYLMEMEFYPSTMPLGGLEYSINKIYQKLLSEGVTFFSLGVTFGVAPDNEVNTDPLLAEILSELWSQRIFDGRGNYQFKNKFRTVNHPLILYRFLDFPEDNLIDIIMFIANPVGIKAQQQAIVESLGGDTTEVRSQADCIHLDYFRLQSFHYNTLFIPSQQVEYDLLTDSWSELAWTQTAAINNMSSSENTDYDLISSLQSIFPFTYIIPVTSGRYAEALLFETLPKDKKVIAQNILFPTTVQNQIRNGFQPLEIPVDEVYNLQGKESYRGNIDIVKLEASLNKGNIGYVVVEMENNASGGAPVSLQNLLDVRNLCNKFGIELIIDATRVVENSLFIIEQGFSDKSPLALSNEMLACADYVIASLTKDFTTPVGGIIATNNTGVYNRISERISIQGSGLNIYDKNILYSNLQDKEKITDAVIDRKRFTEKLWTSIKNDLPLITPFGGHCILVDITKLKELKNLQYPAQAFLNWLFLKTGIRGGIHSGGLDKDNSINKLVRLVIPVGLKENDIDEIIRRICSSVRKEQDFRDLTLVQKGENSFGMIKNKYEINDEVTKSKQHTNDINLRKDNVENTKNHENDGLVAIVGVSGRYPEAESLYQFWNNLISKKDCINEIPRERWDYRLFYDPDKMVHGKNPSKWGGFLKDVDKFDPQFFQITPIEAEKMDPQQRLFLQTAWQVIEDAGYALSDFRKQTNNNVGVFVGATWSEYSYLADADKAFYPEVNLGSISTRVSYQLGFEGPTLTVDTHCSSSLSALYLAYESVKNGACKAAIAGGVNLSIHPNKYQAAKYFLSPTGRCHSFGTEGDGYVPGEGVGAVLLKPLSDAIESNDHIYGVIRCALMRHGGKTAGATVPNPKSQADLIKETYEKAKINPETISYVEAHGTGTQLGDPIEIEGLTSAFSLFTDKKQFCSIGSVKSNIGHLEAAAGISQITKVLLQFKYRKLLPSIHSEVLNPNIEFEATPFFVQRELADWKLPESASYPRRSAISSFGAGGVNCHCVLEEYSNKYLNTNKNQSFLIPLSAKSKNVLFEYIRAFDEFLINEGQEIPLANIAYTLQLGREAFNERVVFICSTANELKELCGKFINGQLSSQIITGSPLKSAANKNAELDNDCVIDSNRLKECASAWANGKTVDWNGIFNYSQMKRVPLPTYPFEKESYWAPCNETGLQAKNLFQNPINDDIAALENDKITCYKKVFKTVQNTGNESVKNKIVVFDNDEKICNYLKSSGYKTVLVKSGEQFISLGEDSFTVNPLIKQDFNELWTKLYSDKQFNGITIVYLWGNQIKDRAWEEYAGLITTPLVNLCGSLNRYALREQVSIVCGFQTKNTFVDLFNESLTAFFKTINLENHNFCIKAISSCNNSDFHLNILQEMRAFNDKVEYVKYERNNRQMAFYEPFCKDNSQKGEVLRKEGIYIVTGGAKGIGYYISQYLASAKQARLVLVGRSPIDSFITDRIKLLEEQGSKVVYIQADITKKDEVKKIIKVTKDTFGAINGIIHSAGIIKDAYLIKKKDDEFNKVVEPKILGTVYLDECTCNEALDIFVLFSSLAAILGNVGQCDYSFGNSFMDNYAHYREELRKSGQRSGQSISINWPLWEEGGMQIPDIKKEILFEQTGLEVLSTKDGINTFLNAVKSNCPQILVTIGDQSKIKKIILDQQESQIIHALEENTAEAHVPVCEDNKLEQIYVILRELIAEGTKLPIHKISLQTQFEEYGMDSVMIEYLILKLEKHFGKLSSTLLFEYQSIAELAQYLVNNQQEAVKKYFESQASSKNIAEKSYSSSHKAEGALSCKDYKSDDIAIIGVSGIYPKAKNIEEFWSNLEKGLDCVTEVPTDRWDWRSYYDEEVEKAQQGKIYCKWGGFIDNVECFDTILFNISPKEAQTIDPQERLFLQNVWELLESSAYTREALARKYPNGKGSDVGVFVGVTTNTYQLLGHEQWEKGNHIVPNSVPWSIPNRVSFFFNFNGPSVAIDTACSSSLTAIHSACESLKNNECKIAVAGGVNLYFHPSKYIAMCQLGMLSKKGKCHAFGADADGFVPGEGIGAVLLKPLSAAIEDGDKIWGVIKGTSTNHGGRTNGYKVPSPGSQALLINKALENAGLKPTDINYIEAHGTGTSLGDPIEIEGLTQAYMGSVSKKQICPIGSVKTNIGHAEAAAGIAGLTKVLLQMKHKTLVSSLHAQQLNKHIDFENTPFYVQREVAAWNTDKPGVPLRAGISSFGAGGVNAHVIVEEYVEQLQPSSRRKLKTEDLSASNCEQLIVFSARNKEQLDELMEKYLEFLLLKEVSLEDLSYTLQTAREEMEERLAFVVSNQDLLIEGIRGFLNGITNNGFTCVGNKNDSVKSNHEVNEKDRREKAKILLFERDLHKIASLWVWGESFDWTIGHKETAFSKLCLPTYPMAFKKYWVYPKEHQPVVYLAANWVDGSFSEQMGHESNIMVVGTKNQSSYMQTIVQNHPSQSIYKVYLGKQNTKIEQNIFEVDIDRGVPDFSFVKGDTEIDTIYFLGGLTTDKGGEFSYQFYQEHQNEGALALIGLLKTFDKNITIKVITNQCFNTKDNGFTDYNLYSATLTGLCKTISQEYQSVRVIHIDLPTAELGSFVLQEGLVCSIKEQYDENFTFVAYRDKKRLLRILEKAELPLSGGLPIIKPNGTYLVLGGTGGIGSLVAQSLVKRYNAKVILIGKSQLNAEKQQQINSIKRLGGEVSYYEADINDTDKTMQIISDIQKNHRAIDGVIHSAALVQNCLLKDMTPDIYHRVVGTQILCCLLIKEVHQTLGINNFIVFSSASSYFGNQGGANYNASNSFKDTFSAAMAQDDSLNIRLINWGLWSLGLGKTYEKVLQQKFNFTLPIQPIEGIKAFHKIINTDIMQVIPITASDEFLKSKTHYYGQQKSTKGNILSENHFDINSIKGKQVPLKEQLIALLKSVVGDNLKLDSAAININVHLGDYGMDSIAGVSILKDLNSLIGNLPSTLMYELFTIASLTDYILKEHQQSVASIFCSDSLVQDVKEKNKVCEAKINKKSEIVVNVSTQNSDQNEAQKTGISVKNRDIAIIGLNGIYPNAENLEDFWNNLVDKVDCITEIPTDRWEYKTYEQDGSIYGKWGGFIQNPDYFDPLFFNISPKEAKGIDPQERLFLQVAYNTFVDAGYTREGLNNKKIGVFAGVTNNTYQLIGLENWNNSVKEDIPHSLSWSVANRVSFIFNLKGPSIPVDTACSSSLSAVHFACESILSGESEMALVGGVNLYLHPYKYAGLCQMNMLSPTGRCRAFNDEADGFVPGEGVGAILLKPMQQALQDGDNIYGIIKGTSVNHGGRTNGYTVPNPNAQAELIQNALNKADINPRSISYVEAHGTGTVLGDPIEISGLTMAFRKYTSDKQFCSIGSVKTNIGHLEAAGGIVGITKILLQMKNRKIAPSLYTDPVNSRIDFKETPFYLQPTVTDWQRTKVVENGKEITYPRRASISAFGAGGANAHVIIEEFEPKEENNIVDEENTILISAKTTEQVISIAKDLLKTIKEKQLSSQMDFNLRNMAYTLQTSRDEMEERLAIVTNSLEDLARKLDRFIGGDKIAEGIYCGRVSKEIVEEQTDSFGKNMNLNELAMHWVEGYQVNWKALYKGGTPRKLSLSLYPFLQKRLLLSKETNVKEVGKTQMQIHPMLHSNVSTLNCLRFNTEFSGNEFFIKDHKVNGNCLFPGAGFMEMAMKAAILTAENKPVFLKNITFIRPWTVESEGTKTEILIKQQQQNIIFQVQSLQGNKEAKMYTRGEIDYFDVEREKCRHIDWLMLKDRGQCFHGNQIYDFYNNLGLDYGASFQCIEKLYVSNNNLLAQLVYNKTIIETKKDFVLHPALLDGALQSIVGFELSSESNTPCLPFFIKSIKVLDHEKEWKYVHAEKVIDNNLIKYNIVILDEGGNPLVFIDDFTVRPIRDLNKEIKVNVKKVLSCSQKDEAPSDTLISDIKHKIGSMLELDEEEINNDTELGDYGFDSLSFTNLADVINRDYNLTISPTLFFEYPTINVLASYLQDKCKVEVGESSLVKDKLLEEMIDIEEEEINPVNNADSILKLGSTKTRYKVDEDFPVAIIGMAGLMPQSADLDAFWTSLVNGENLITEIPSERWNWQEYYGDPIKQKNKTMAKWGGFVKDIDKFDARFFNIAAREAELMDPQQRIMLELAWNTVENAGYSISSLSGSKTGVFIGVAANTEYNDLLNKHMEETEAYQATGVTTSVLVNRISYMFNWHGLSEPIDTACSSSLVAIHRAIDSMRNGDCDMVLAGATNLILTPRGAISFSKSGMLSPDGCCKTFDESANGYVRSDGMGLVLLKPLKEAELSGDHIYAVIKGSAVNHGGKGNSITSPNPNAQAEVIVKAYEKAKIDIETVNYIETHGTGTQLGDPVEINGLKKAFEILAKKQGKDSIPSYYCGLGSVKTNVGHLESAAGMASLFKVLLSIKHHQIPPNIHYRELNHNISLENSPFYIVNQNRKFGELKEGLPNTNKPLRASISSFGFGGVNSHIVLEEYIDCQNQVKQDDQTYIIILSAKDKNRLNVKAKMLADFLEKRFESASTTNNETLSNIQSQLVNEVCDILGILPEDIAIELPFVDIGFDKITLSAIAQRIDGLYNIKMRIDQIIEKGTILNLCRYLNSIINSIEVVIEKPGYLRSLAYTLQVGRDEMEERVCWIVSSISELVNNLRDFCISGHTQYCVRVGRKNQKELKVEEDVVQSALEKKDFSTLIALWLKGSKLDWKLLYSNQKIQRLELPEYPFYRTRYWFDNKLANSDSKIQVVPANYGDFRYMLELDPWYSLLADHVIEDKVILPGAFYFELIDLVIRKHFNNSKAFQIDNLFWLSPYVFQNEYGNRLYINFDEGKSSKLKVSSVTNGKITDHFQGDILWNVDKSSARPISIQDIQTRCRNQISCTDLYSTFRQHGLNYGHMFQTVSDLHYCDQEALSYLQLKEDSIYNCTFHPSLIDGAFQSVAGIDNTSDDKSNSMVYLPFSLKSFCVYGSINQACYAYIQQKGNQKDFKKYDLLILNPLGDVVAKFVDFGLKGFPIKQRQSEITYFIPKYSPIQVPNNYTREQNIPVIIIDSTMRLKDVFSDQQNVYWIKPSSAYCKKREGMYEVNLSEFGDVSEVLSEIISKEMKALTILVNLDCFDEMGNCEYDIFFKTFKLTQTLIKKYYHLEIRFNFFFSKSEENIDKKALASYGRTVNLENGNFSFKFIEYDYLSERDMKEEFSDLFSGCYEINYAGNIRYQKLLSEADISSKHKLIRKGGTFVIVGGNGGLGQILAKHLLHKYQSNIVIISRSILLTPIFEELKEYEKYGGSIYQYQADVSDLKNIEKCFVQLKQQFKEIHGIFHLAGVLNDSFIFRKAEADIRGVFGPKIKGICNLDTVTKDFDLELFCVFSSITSITGNKGQADYAYANRYLDEFVHWRNEQKVKGLRSGHSCSINWPLWEQGGMQVNQNTKEKLQKENGLEILKDSDGMNIFDLILDSDYQQVIPLQANQNKIKDLFSTLNLYAFKKKQPEKVISVSSNLKQSTAIKVNIDNQLRITEKLRKLFSETLKIDKNELDIEEDLEVYGFDSLMMVEVLSRLESYYKISVDPSIINQYKTIQNLAQYLDDNIKEQEPEPSEIFLNEEIHMQDKPIEKVIIKEHEQNEKIAVIGIACRFPQSRDMEEYWDNLINERDLITQVPQNRWDVEKYFDPNKMRKDSSYSKWGGFIQDVENFDASYWGIPDEVAMVMDPQHRILLELAEELWSNSGYTKDSIKGKNIGVYIGGAESSYIKGNLDKVPAASMKHIVLNTIQNIMAARISDTYDLVGPSLTLDTACSSSLVSIHQACSQIRDGSCDMAIAGGIQLLLDPIDFIGMSQAGVLSPEKQAYVFDERAKGIVIGEGAGLVLLKPLKKAIEDGDMIHAVLLGSAINNDGHTMGLSTPNIEGQKAVIRQALKNSEISPETISYYEAHGTGTLLGDPIEVRAATQVYQEFSKNKNFCGIGSVKANMGHLLRAAGIASFIKVVLSIKKGMMVKTIHCEKPHPRFNFPASPFFPVVEKKEWVGINGRKRAAISSFGFGGTNCHMVLEDFNPNQYVGYHLMKYPLGVTQFNKKVYWLGREITNLEDDLYHQILLKLQRGEITPEEALTIETQVIRRGQK